MMRKTVASLSPSGDFRSWLPKPISEMQDEIRPLDHWEEWIPPELLSMASDYRILLAPLFGQYVKDRTPENWCGRTSAACIYNFRQLKDLPPNVDPMTRYIAMRSEGAKMQICLPNKSEAWPGGTFSGDLTSPRFEYGLGSLDSIFSRAEMIQHRGEAQWAMEVFKKARFLDSIDKNNPIQLYSRFSGTKNQMHIICITGYLVYEKELWLLVLNPATFNEIEKTNKVPLHPKSRTAAQFLADPRGVLTEADLINIQPGNYNCGLGAIAFVRARHFFDDHPREPNAFLYAAREQSGNRPGGAYHYGKQFFAAPDELVLTPGFKPMFSYPIPLGAGSAIHAYASVEGRAANGESRPTAGGFFPVGLRGQIHPGLHLVPNGQSATPVIATAPGEIVALRMGPRGTTSHDGEAKISNWSNFVLLRHELQWVENEKPSDPLRYYSLYMHLAPPAWWQVDTGLPAPASKTEDVPWLKRWSQARHGLLIKIRKASDPAMEDGFPVGQILRAAAEVPHDGWKIVGDGGGNAAICKIWNPTDGSVKTRNFPASTNVQDAVWIYKAPPPDLAQRCQAMADGETIFLDGHYLTVKEGEVVGIADQFRSGNENVKKEYPQEVVAMFLHWEVFSDPKDDTFEKIAKRFLEQPEAFWKLPTDALPTELEKVPEALNKLLDVSQLPANLLPGLPAETDPKKTSKILDLFQKASFSSQGTLKLKFQIDHLPKPSQMVPPKAALEIPIHFLRQVKGAAPDTLEEVGKPITVRLEDKDWPGPIVTKEIKFESANADVSSADFEKIRLDYDDTFLYVAWKGATSLEESLRALVKPLWRDLQFDRVSDWCLAGAKASLTEEEKDIKPEDLAWWTDKGVVFSKEKAPAKPEDPLNRGLPSFLPTDSKVRLVHPITWTNLLEVAFRSRKPGAGSLQFRKDWTRDQLPEETRKKIPQMMVQLDPPAGAPLAPGQVLRMLASDDHYYASGLETGSVKMRLEPEGSDRGPSRDFEFSLGEFGVAMPRIPLSVWGSWKLSLLDAASESPSGSMSLKIPAPEIDQKALESDLHQPLPIGGDRFSWALPWKGEVQADSFAAVMELVLIVEEKWTATGIAVYAHAEPSPTPKSVLFPIGEEWVLGEDGFITSTGKNNADKKVKDKNGNKVALPSDKITKNFKHSEWLKVAPEVDKKRTVKLHPRLALGVQDLRDLGALDLVSLKADGLGCTIKVNSKDLATKMERQALNTGIFASVGLAAVKGVYHLDLAIEAATKRSAVYHFDLAPALAKAAELGLTTALDAASMASKLAGAATSAAGFVAKVASWIPGGEKTASVAGQVKSTGKKVPPPPPAPRYSVAFHLVPDHFLTTEELDDGLVSPAEWASLMTKTNLVGVVPGLASGAPTAGDAKDSLLGAAKSEAGSRLGADWGAAASEGLDAAVASAPASGPVGVVATRVLGSVSNLKIGSDIALVPGFTKKGEKRFVSVQVPLVPDKKWSSYRLLLQGTCDGEDVKVVGTAAKTKVEFQLPWPAGPSPEAFEGMVVAEPPPLGVANFDPRTTKIDMPDPVVVNIDWEPSWVKGTASIASSAKAVVIQVTCLGLRGANVDATPHVLVALSGKREPAPAKKGKKASKPPAPIKVLPDTDRVGLSVVDAITGASVTPLPLLDFNVAGFTTADIHFRVGMVLTPKILSGMAVGRHRAVFKARDCEDAIVEFSWDGSKVIDASQATLRLKSDIVESDVDDWLREEPVAPTAPAPSEVAP